jgi:hypothetical protein
MLASADPKARLRLVCNRLAWAALSGDYDAHHCLGGAERGNPDLYDWGQGLGQTDNSNERGEQHAGTYESGSIGRRSGVSLIVAGLHRKEVVAVAYGLNEDKRAIEKQRDESGKDQLGRAEIRPRCSCRDVRQNKREDRERRQYGQCSTRPVDMESLFVMTGAAP